MLCSETVPVNYEQHLEFNMLACYVSRLNGLIIIYSP